MGLRDADIALLSADYPSLRVIARQPGLAGQWGAVQAVEVSINGIRGMGSRLSCRYGLIIDTSALTAAIPPVWVRSPADAAIRHVNIWHSGESFCRWAGTNLPSFCWYQFGTAWTDAPAASRTLGAALEYIKQFLNTENHDSSAR
jgi:hypothetical protein